MTKTLKFSLIVMFFMTISCGQDKTEKTTIQETPVALQDNDLEIKSYSRSDIVEELYQELVEKTPQLKRLENDLATFNSVDHAEKFDNYDNKSSQYYNVANGNATTITDTILRKRILSIIENSQKEYENKTKELKSLRKLISDNNSTINDYHSTLKIILTLPLIQKYQSDNLPEKIIFKDGILEQERLIKQLDSLTWTR